MILIDTEFDIRTVRRSLSLFVVLGSICLSSTIYLICIKSHAVSRLGGGRMYIGHNLINSKSLKQPNIGCDKWRNVPPNITAIAYSTHIRYNKLPLFDIKSTLENNFGLHHTELKIFLFFYYFFLLYIFSVCCAVIPNIEKKLFRSELTFHSSSRGLIASAKLWKRDISYDSWST